MHQKLFIAHRIQTCQQNLANYLFMCLCLLGNDFAERKLTGRTISKQSNAHIVLLPVFEIFSLSFENREPKMSKKYETVTFANIGNYFIQ